MTRAVTRELPAQLRRFRTVQRPAYECAQAVAAQPQPGLRAVGPHLGRRGTDAKFEEILLVTDSGDPQESAFWLDGGPPWGSPRVSACERGGLRRWAEDK